MVHPIFAFMTALSVLDLSPIVEGSDAGQSLRNSLDLARHAERLGYQRFWMAEHHNMPGIASAATAVALAFVGAGTSTIRIGAGGIMLPNHAPLMVAEQFGTLAALFPGRVDLGLGRAPGTDQMTAHALRRHMSGGADTFPRDVVELLHYFDPAKPGQAVRAVPGEGQSVETWILGSSTFGAQLAAMLGLPYAFASHFAPADLERALAVYRQQFQPSERCPRPHVMLGVNVVGAETDHEARRLLTSLQQAFIALRTGNPGKLPPPVDDIETRLEPMARSMLDQVLSTAVVGSPQTVRDGLIAFAQSTGADELMITSSIYDHAARLRSFEIAAGTRAALAA
jgi:luciferase family oxidoreductase group 1